MSDGNNGTKAIDEVVREVTSDAARRGITIQIEFDPETKAIKRLITFLRND